MTETIICTLISALLSAGTAITVCILTNSANNKKLFAELKERDALQAYRIEQLEKKVDKHNSIVERTYHLEEAIAIEKEQIKVANHRIADLEKKGG